MPTIKAPSCLAAGNLYDGQSAHLSWNEIENAAGYEVEACYEESFAAADAGLDWQYTNESEGSFASWEAADMTWAEFEALPARGRTWHNIEFADLDWAGIEAKSMTWGEWRQLAPDHTVYRGEGEQVPGPEQGLTWADMNAEDLTWNEIEGRDLTWLAFHLLYTHGYDWAQFDSRGLSWGEFEALNGDGLTWYELEHLPVKGISWGTFESYYLDWAGLEAKDRTWQDIDFGEADLRPRRGCSVRIPEGRTVAFFRVRAYDASGERSGYFCTTALPIVVLDEFTVDGSLADRHLQVDARNMRKLDNRHFRFVYDPAAVQVGEVYCEGEGERLSFADTFIKYEGPGYLRFECRKGIDPRAAWSGLVLRVPLEMQGEGKTTLRMESWRNDTHLVV